MRDTRKTQIALVAALCAAAFVVLVAASGPAFSEDRQEPATAVETKAAKTAETDVEIVQPAAEVDRQEVRPGTARDYEADGYEWCASRTPANRYLWSHRPS